MCRLQCCGFCSLLDWYDGEQHHFFLSCRLVMGMSAHGQRHCAGISRGSIKWEHAVIFSISLIHTMVTVVTGLHLLVISQHSGKRV